MADSPGLDLSGPAGKIGRYFSILSVIPSALLVSFTLVLADSGAWSGHVDWSAGFAALDKGGFGKVGQIALGSLLFGLILQPLQFALVQLAEGYWGAGSLATKLMHRGIRRHRNTRRTLNQIAGTALAALNNGHQAPGRPGHDSVSDEYLPDLLRYEEAKRALLLYPHEPNDIRPTRLGNVLRRYETAGGAPYGLSLLAVAPHVGLIAPKHHVDYVDDQRTQLDLAIRLALISVLASVLAVVFLWRDGLWLTVAAVPYAMAYLFYRGAVVVAAEYGTALSTVLDLNRFALYDALRLPQPADLRAEQTQAAALTTVLRTDLAPSEREIAQLIYTATADSEAAGDAQAADTDDPVGPAGEAPDS